VIILENKKKLYVGNLSYDTTIDSLKAAFGEFGEIVDAIVITDRNTGRSKGFGFVEFADEAAAQKALEAMNGKEVEGRSLVVNVARPSRDR
jgi:cold-inducible RNA-binding protein